jgi:hypothetical protein
MQINDDNFVDPLIPEPGSDRSNLTDVFSFLVLQSEGALLAEIL